jgi:hypothetical protein
MLSLDVQTRKLHESLDRLFSDIKIEGFLRGLHEVTALFSQNTASGPRAQDPGRGHLQPACDATGAIGPVVKRFFQGMVIGALLVGIGFLKVRNAFRDAFGDSAAFKNMDTARLALYGGVAVVGLLTAGVGALAIAFGLLASPVIAAGLAIYNLYTLGVSAYEAFKSIKWSDLGKSIVDGIVGGLTSSAKWLVDSVKGLGASALDALKGKLEIHSPSKVFAKLGRAIPMGVEAGIQTGTPAMNRSMVNAVSVPSMPYTPRLAPPDPVTAAAPSMASPAASSSSSSASVTIQELHFHTQASEPRERALDFVRQLEDALERVAINIGQPVPGGA